MFWKQQTDDSVWIPCFESVFLHRWEVSYRGSRVMWLIALFLLNFPILLSCTLAPKFTALPVAPRFLSAPTYFVRSPWIQYFFFKHPLFLSEIKASLIKIKLNLKWILWWMYIWGSYSTPANCGSPSRLTRCFILEMFLQYLALRRSYCDPSTLQVNNVCFMLTVAPLMQAIGRINGV